MATTKQVKKPAAKVTAKKPVAKKVTAKKAATKNVKVEVMEAVDAVEAEVTNAANSIFNKLNTNFNSARNLAKQVWFAQLGVVGRSVEEVQTRYSQINEDSQKLVEDGQKLVQDLVVRGEKVQDEAEVLLKEGRANIEEQIEVAKNRLNGFAPVADISARLKEVTGKLEGLRKDLKKSA